MLRRARLKVVMANSRVGLKASLHWLATDFLSRRRRWQAGGVLVLMLLGGVAELFTLAAVFPLLAFMADPEAMQQSRAGALLRDVGINPRDITLPLLGALFSIVAVSAAIIRVTLAWASQKFAYRVGYDLGVALYSRMLHQPYTFHAGVNSSRILSTVNNIQRLLTGMLLPIMHGFSAVLVALFIIAGLIMINPPIALSAILGFGGIYAAVSVTMRRRLRRSSESIHMMMRRRTKAVQEGLGGIRDVLIDNSQPVYVKKFARLDQRLRDAQAATALIGVAPRFLVEALGMVFIVAMAMILNAVNGTLSGSLPVLAVLALGAQRLMPLLQQVYHAWVNLMANRATLLDVTDLLNLPIPPRFELEGAPVQLTKTLTLDRVSFRYGPDAPLVLRDINLEIGRGSRVGFIGKTGSGKSTLIDLVMGLLQPSSGMIRVDGVPLDEGNVISWQRQIAHVSQHIFLADASVTENVAFGVPEQQIDHERVYNACRQAELEEFFNSLPEGYDTRVGEKGIRLSGGQRQRVGIARALYKNASILVLDEATSALDDDTEAAIMASVERLGRDYTVLMIAHRLTTLRNCDLICRLDNGRIVQQGSYGEVIGRGPMDVVAARA
jgi:ABC-type bacteriocin/lantibiotic exporter with double-glycine peptidase domain